MEREPSNMDDSRQEGSSIDALLRWEYPARSPPQCSTTAIPGDKAGRYSDAGRDGGKPDRSATRGYGK